MIIRTQMLVSRIWVKMKTCVPAPVCVCVCRLESLSAETLSLEGLVVLNASHNKLTTLKDGEVTHTHTHTHTRTHRQRTAYAQDCKERVCLGVVTTCNIVTRACTADPQLVCVCLCVRARVCVCVSPQE